MNTKIILAATAAALTVTGAATTVAIAQQAGDNAGPLAGKEMTIDRVLEGAERMFNLIDADNDGVLSEAEIEAGPQRPGKNRLSMDDLPLTAEEAQAKLAETFAAMDADGNGEVTMAERAAYREAQLAETGVAPKAITLDDFTAKGMRPFNMVDANDDGVVTEEEVAAMEAQKGQKAEGRGFGKGGKKGGKGDGMGRGKGGRGDKGGKGLIKVFIGEDGLTAGMTWDDVQAKVTEAFNGLDADASGGLSRDEIRPVMEALRGQRGNR